MVCTTSPLPQPSEEIYCQRPSQEWFCQLWRRRAEFDVDFDERYANMLHSGSATYLQDYSNGQKALKQYGRDKIANVIPANLTTMPSLTREPMYQQLNQLLRSLVGSPEFPAGGQFLTERQVSERFQVSRATANKALSNLVSEGLLTFRKGVGTFVSPRSMDYNLRALVSFTEEAIAAGKRPETRVLRFEEISASNAPEAVAEALQASLQDKLWYLERLRLADSLPVILERRHIAARYCPRLNARDLGGSLYRVWKERYHLEVEGAEETIRAVNIRRSEAVVLHTRQNTAGLLITSVGYLVGHEPLWFEKTLYRGDAYEFHNRLGGIQPAGEPFGKFLGGL